MRQLHAERRRRETRKALRTAKRQLAQTFFQKGVKSLSDGRVTVATLQFSCALFHSDRHDPLQPSYRRLLVNAITSDCRAIPLAMRLRSGVTCIQFSPDDNCLMAGSSAELGFWDARTGIASDRILKITGGSLAAAVFRADGQYIRTITNIGLEPRRTEAWDANTLMPVGELQGGYVFINAHQSLIPTPNSAFFLDCVHVRRGADGDRLPGGSGDSSPGYETYVMDGWTGKPLRLLMRRTRGPVSFAEFCGDNTHVLVGFRTIGGDDEPKAHVQLWDAVAAQPAGMPITYSAVATSAAMDQSARWAVVQYEDGTIHRYDLKAGNRLGTPISSSGRSQMEISPDGKRFLVTTNSTVTVRDLQTGESAKLPRQPLHCVLCALFSPDGSRILVGGYNSSGTGEARLWDLVSGRALGGTFQVEGHVTCLAFSHAGTFFACGSDDGEIRVWTEACRAESLSIGVPNKDGRGAIVAFNSDGALIAIGRGSYRELLTGVREPFFEAETVTEQSGTTELWNFRTRTQIGQSLHHSHAVNRVQFNSAGDRLVTHAYDSAILCNARTGEAIGTAFETCRGVAFTTDGSQFVTVSSNGAAQRRCSESGESAGEPMNWGGLHSLVFSPDGRFVLTRSDFKGTCIVRDVITSA